MLAPTKPPLDKLLRGHIRHPQFRILAVPLRRDAVESQAEGLSLTGSERRNSNVYRFKISSIGSDHLQRHFLPLRQLSHRVLEHHLDHDMGHGLVSIISNASVDVAD